MIKENQSDRYFLSDQKNIVIAVKAFKGYGYTFRAFHYFNKNQVSANDFPECKYAV